MTGAPERGDRLPRHDEGRRLGELHTGCLRDEGDCARGPGVGLDDVENVGDQGELDVEQPLHAHAFGDRLGGASDASDLRVGQGHGWHDAGGVTGVDTGLLNVLHDAAEEQLAAVIKGVDIDLDGVVEETVDE